MQHPKVSLALGGSAPVHRRSRDGVRSVAALAPDIDQNTRVLGRVRAREVNKVAASAVAGAGDVNLGTLHVELSSAKSARNVQGDQLNAHEVVARGNAGREVKVEPAVVLDHGIDSPDTSLVVETTLGDLEPSKAIASRLGSIVNLSKVNNDGT